MADKPFVANDQSSSTGFMTNSAGLGPLSDPDFCRYHQEHLSQHFEAKCVRC